MIWLCLAQAYEVDNFTGRYKPLKDSGDVLNTEVNFRLKKALKQVNEKSVMTKLKRALSLEKSCSRDDLYSAVGAELLGGVVGSLERFAEKSPSIAKSNVDEDGKIYEGGNAGGMLSLAGVEPSINLRGHFVGVDKLGHFFDQGHDYYRVSKKTSGSLALKIDTALSYGRRLEEGRYGLVSTGVKSYADLAANYGGYLFWSQLTEGVNPYFKCSGQNWVQIRSFDFKQYVNPGWDEAINCSTYDQDLAKDVAAAQKKLEYKSKNKRKFTCPVSITQCRRMISYYGIRASQIISPTCQTQAKNAKIQDKDDYYSVQPIGTVYKSAPPKQKSGGVKK